MVGRKKGVEYHTLVIGTRFVTGTYAWGDYSAFLNQITEAFVKKIANEKMALEIGILNGYGKSDDGICQLEELEDTRLLESKLLNGINQLGQGCTLGRFYPELARNMN